MSDTVVSMEPLVPVAPITVPLFAHVRIPLSDGERASPPVVTLVDDDRGFHANIDPENARAILAVECQIHIDMVYVVTRTPQNEYILWRQEHTGLVPVQMSLDMRQRMLSAPGSIKRWTTGDLRIHELETDGRHDMQVAILSFVGIGGSSIEAEAYISLGTVQLSDSDWLRNWIVVLGNGRRVAGPEYDVTRIIKL